MILTIANEVQRTSAGTGIMHSEFNYSKTDPVHLLQIWILPEVLGLQPGYEQKSFKQLCCPGNLTLLFSLDGRDNRLIIQQEINIYVLDLRKGQNFTYSIGDNHMLWLRLARGKTIVNNNILEQGDALYTNKQQNLRLLGIKKSEVIVFNLPMTQAIT